MLAALDEMTIGDELCSVPDIKRISTVHTLVNRNWVGKETHINPIGEALIKIEIGECRGSSYSGIRGSKSNLTMSLRCVEPLKPLHKYPIHRSWRTYIGAHMLNQEGWSTVIYRSRNSPKLNDLEYA